mmetsp:Transcript_32953/g.78680  ORF Transcript_32953/g.78680 Transcript_32953/m.78680 type:complete len:297 (-) Transcript_32953:1088-1978(-)
MLFTGEVWCTKRANRHVHSRYDPTNPLSNILLLSTLYSAFFSSCSSVSPATRKIPLSLAICSNSSTICGAAGTSRVRSGNALRNLLAPFPTWYSETMELSTKNLNRAAIASRDDDSDVWLCPSSSMAILIPRLTSSWWKWGAFNSRTQLAASSSSRDIKYSLSNWSIASFSSATGRPSPGPQTFSRRAVQCSLDRRLTAFSTTQSPGWELFRSERKAGARTSSTTARARKHPTMDLASGMSITKSSIESSSTSKPIPISSSVNGTGCRQASSRLTSSLSLGPSSSPRLTARFTTSG